jgi:hypothetical protein
MATPSPNPGRPMPGGLGDAGGWAQRDGGLLFAALPGLLRLVGDGWSLPGRRRRQGVIGADCASGTTCRSR